jgi:uncharacterized protein
MDSIYPALLSAIREQYRLDWYGIHGIQHWARVWAIGQRLASRTGADVDVVTLFAIFHDACRHNDDRDPRHGQRGAKLARSFHDTLLHLPAARCALLTTACALHTKGLLRADITVQVCWDADRLDLGRVGIRPDPTRLCTAAARDPAVLRWAASLDGVLPREWNLHSAL